GPLERLARGCRGFARLRRRGARGDFGRRRPRGRAERHLGRVPGHQRPRLRHGGAHGGGGLRRRRARHRGGNRPGRPPEPRRRGLGVGPPLARRGPRGRGGGRAELGGRPRRQHAPARQPGGPARILHRHFGTHRRPVLAQHRPVGDGHLGHRQLHRRGGDAARRRQLVLPHRGLRARPRDRPRRQQLHRGAGRPRARRRPPPAGDQRSVFPAAPGALLAREDRGARQRRRGHDQRREAGGRVRRRPALRAVAGGDARLHQRRPRHGPPRGAGRAADRGVLLGHERGDARLEPPLRRAHGRQPRAEHQSSGRLLRDPGLPARRRRGGHGRRAARGARDEARAVPRPAVRRHDGQARRARGPRHAPVRGQEAGGEPPPLRLLQGGPHHPGRAGVPPHGGGRLPAGAL
ncbi:MAG: ABC transporter, substrate-binding protein (cluster 4, leucine/isoleucine/valine/benzoate), partial [uncultured Acetobacteraceae bacterium]